MTSNYTKLPILQIIHYKTILSYTPTESEHRGVVLFFAQTEKRKPKHFDHAFIFINTYTDNHPNLVKYTSGCVSLTCALSSSVVSNIV